MFQFSKIRYKLLFYFLIVGVIPFSITIYIEYQHVADMLKQRSFDQLTTVREIKKKKIEEYFRQIRQEISFFAQSSSVIDAMNEFKKSFDSISPNQINQQTIEILQKYYAQELIGKIEHHERDTFKVQSIVPKDYKSIFLQSQYLTGNKSNFQPHPYHQTHQKYHATLATFLQTYGYYDIFLIDDQKGHIVYSVAKEIDFGTSLLTDAHKDTNLGKLFRKIRYSGIKNEVLMCDFEPYLPSFLAPAAFIAAPIFAGNQKIGTLVFQIPIDRIDAVMTNNKSWKEEGFGETGESYIVGNDYKMRSDSRFIIEDESAFIAQLEKNKIDTNEIALIKFYKTTVLFQNIRTQAVAKAIGNRKGTEIIKDYRGVDVLSSFTPLEIANVKWVLIAEIDADEAFSPVRAFAIRSLTSVLIAALFVAGLSLLIAHSIAKPVMELVEKINEMSKGNLDIRAPIRTKDEISILATALNENAQSLKIQRNEIEQQMEEISAQAEALREANEEVAVRNEELRQNMEEIEAQRDDILQKSSEIEQQMEEISTQAEALREANQKISKQHDNILSSIVYARRIQTALLPKKEIIQAYVPQLLLLYMPKDIVSGDFYWFTTYQNQVFLAIADCTGHGVPGAFMTVVGQNLLDQIINKDGIQQPAHILTQLDERLLKSLQQQGIESEKINDGMDIALLKIELSESKVTFAGAGRPIWVFENGNIEPTEYKGDKFPIGSSQYKQKQFTEKEIFLKKDDIVYAFTDGYADQFGVERKFTTRRFRQLLQEIRYYEFADQERLLLQNLHNWKGNEEQTDDVLVAGIKF